MNELFNILFIVILFIGLSITPSVMSYDTCSKAKEVPYTAWLLPSRIIQEIPETIRLKGIRGGTTTNYMYAPFKNACNNSGVVTIKSLSLLKSQHPP